MAESVKASEDPKVAADVIEGEAVQRVKPVHGVDGSATDVSAASPLPVDDDASQTLLSAIKALLEGTAVVKVTDGGSTIGVDDNGSTLSVDDGGGSLTVDLGAPLPVGANLIGAVEPRGSKAHDEVDTGNPVKVGGRARSALPAAVAQDDRADFLSDIYGRQLVTTIPLAQRVSATLNRTDATSGQIFAALAEGAYVVTAITVMNAGAVSTKVEILDEASAKWKGYAVKEGGGFTISDPNGLFVTTKNQKLNGKCVMTGADIDISVSAYKIPA